MKEDFGKALPSNRQAKTIKPVQKIPSKKTNLRPN